MKTEGLTQAQMVENHPPSALTLAGLLYHLALVEESSMEVRFSGLPDANPGEVSIGKRTQIGSPGPLRSCSRGAAGPLPRHVERSRVVVSAASGLDQRSARPMRDALYFRFDGCCCTS